MNARGNIDPFQARTSFTAYCFVKVLIPRFTSTHPNCVIDLRMSDANDVTTQELREECEASPSITGEQQQSTSFGSKFVSVIPRFRDLSFLYVETRVNVGRSAQDCLKKHCGGLTSDTDIKGILDFRHVPLQPTIGFPVPRKKRKQIFILTPVPS